MKKTKESIKTGRRPTGMPGETIQNKMTREKFWISGSTGDTHDITPCVKDVRITDDELRANFIKVKDF